MKKRKIVEMRKCEFCQKEFEVYTNNPQKKYCSGKCWCRANNLDDKYYKHYLGAHKNKRRKKKK
jgi:hypothetical protein